MSKHTTIIENLLEVVYTCTRRAVIVVPANEVERIALKAADSKYPNFEIPAEALYLVKADPRKGYKDDKCRIRVIDPSMASVDFRIGQAIFQRDIPTAALDEALVEVATMNVLVPLRAALEANYGVTKSGPSFGPDIDAALKAFTLVIGPKGFHVEMAETLQDLRQPAKVQPVVAPPVVVAKAQAPVAAPKPAPVPEPRIPIVQDGKVVGSAPASVAAYYAGTPALVATAPVAAPKPAPAPKAEAKDESPSTTVEKLAKDLGVDKSKVVLALRKIGYTPKGGLHGSIPADKADQIAGVLAE